MLVDDTLQAMGWQEDRRRRGRDAEVITTALAAAFFFGGNQAKARVALHQTRLIAQGGQCQPALFGGQFPRWPGATTSAPNAAAWCQGTRRSGGKNAGKRRFFYGVRVVRLLTEAGAPLEFAFLPGAAFDVRAYNQLPLCLPPGSEVYGDTAYVSEELETLAREHEGVAMCVCLRRDSVRR